MLRPRSFVELLSAKHGCLGFGAMERGSVMLRSSCHWVRRCRPALKSAAHKSPFSKIFSLALVLGMLHSGAYAQECLFFNNDRVKLKESVVYENGRLRFRIDGWSSPADAKGTVDIKSNAPSFNQEIVTDVRGSRHFFVRKDTSLCPGSEVTANCESTYGPWRCLFSEF